MDMRHYLQFGRFGFQLQAAEQGRQALVMGILNITPDSFSDAGKFQHLEFALSRATKLARSMVTRFGMSDSMGVMVYEDSENEGFFGGATKTISEATQQKVDAEIRSILDTQYALSRKLLESNRDKVEMMTKALLEWETIDAEQINDIMAGLEPRPPKVIPPRRNAGDSGAGGISPNVTAPA